MEGGQVIGIPLPSKHPYFRGCDFGFEADLPPSQPARGAVVAAVLVIVGDGQPALARVLQLAPVDLTSRIQYRAVRVQKRPWWTS